MTDASQQICWLAILDTVHNETLRLKNRLLFSCLPVESQPAMGHLRSSTGGVLQLSCEDGALPL